MNLILTPEPAQPRTWPTYAELKDVRFVPEFTLAGHRCEAPHGVTFGETALGTRQAMSAYFPRLLVPRDAVATRRRDIRYELPPVGSFGVLISPLDWDIALAQASKLPSMYVLSHVVGLVATGGMLDALIAAGEA